jgi:hypothetical protein
MSLHKVSIVLTSLLILAAGAPAFAESNDNMAISVTESLGRTAPVRVNRESNTPISNNYVHIDNLSDFVYRVHTRAIFQPRKVASNCRRPRTKVGIPGGLCVS